MSRRRSSGASVDAAVDRLQREEAGSGERWIDLRLDLVDELTGEIWLSAGGRWDRRLDAFDGRAKNRVVVRCHTGQKAAVLWFRDWLDRHAYRRDNPPPMPANLDGLLIDTDPACVYSALFAGGRRAGKTWIGVALAWCYAIRFKGSIVWLVGPTEDDFDELTAYSVGLVATEWLDRETADEWELCNGSVVRMRSAYAPESLKQGRVDFALLNEGQRCKYRAFTLLRGAISDRAGMVLVCANPPADEKDQTWVSDFAADAHAGKRASMYVEFSALDNPHIDRVALLAMASEVDERTFEIEVYGRFLSPKDAVAYNWNRLVNERGRPRPTPDIGHAVEPIDCTAEVLAMMGEGEGITHIIGCDFQRFPYMAGVIFKLYTEPGTLPDPLTCYAWIVGEVVLDGGDEVGLSDGMYEWGLSPDTTLVIADASGRYQHSRRRKADAPPPEWRGRGSFDVLKGEGWWRIVVPDRRMKRNPEIVDRARSFTSMICTKRGKRRLFCDAERAPRTAKAIREWRVVNGRPSREANAAHIGDGASYVTVRLFPRRFKHGKPGPVGQPTIATEVDRTPVRKPPAPDSWRGARSHRDRKGRRGSY
jgi:hypothetical protein